MTPHWRHLVKLITFPRGQGVATSVRTSIHAHPLWLHFHICKINYLVDDRFSNTAKSSSCCIFMPDENSIETLQTTENAIATRLISVLLRILVLEEVSTHPLLAPKEHPAPFHCGQLQSSDCALISCCCTAVATAAPAAVVTAARTLHVMHLEVSRFP